MQRNGDASEWGETPTPSPRPVSDFSTPRLDDTSSTRVASLYDNEPQRMQAVPAPFTDKYEQPTAMDSEMLDSTGAVKVQQQKKPKNAKEAVKDGFFGFWLSSHTVDPKYDRDRYIYATLKELVMYCIFLAVLSVIVYGSLSTSSYQLSTALTTLFTSKDNDDDGITYNDIITKAQYWKYLKGPLMDVLYEEHWYDGEAYALEQRYTILHESKILSTPLLRMLRVNANDSCRIEEAMEDLYVTDSSCYPSYKSSRENKTKFGPVDPETYNTTEKITLNYPEANGNVSVLDINSQPLNITAWEYKSSKELNGIPFWGQISHYGAGGFVQKLPSPDGTLNAKEKAVAIINHLQAGNWLERGSRAIFLDFLLYNANLNLFIVSRVSMEFPAMGGTVPHTTFRVVELLRYTTKFDTFVLVCEFIYCAFILYYIIEECIEISIHRLNYFKSFWNIMDLIVLLVSLVVIGLSVYRYLIVKDRIQDYYQSDGQNYLRYEYTSFEALAYVQGRYSDALAILVFFAWIKLFKYISFSKTMNSMNETLARAAKDILAFGVMFFIFFFAYAQLGYMVFGNNVKDYSSFKSAVFTLLRMILGDFKFNELEIANRVIGPLYFLTFIFLVIFILINMFLAIIIDTYSGVKAELETEKGDFDISDYLKRGYYNVLRRLHLRKDRLTDIQSTIDNAEHDHKQINFDEWKDSLIERGFSMEYIETMFAKYDTDGDRVLNHKEMMKIEADLSREKTELSNEENEINDEMDELVAENEADKPEDIPKDILSFEELNVLNVRLDGVEQELRKVLNDLDLIVETLEQREIAKNAHREIIANIIAEKYSSSLGEKEASQNFVADISSEINRFMVDYN